MQFDPNISDDAENLRRLRADWETLVERSESHAVELFEHVEAAWLLNRVHADSWTAFNENIAALGGLIYQIRSAIFK
jgi:hypothetical protein